MTNIDIHCGCGWKSTASSIDKQVSVTMDVMNAAIQHAKETGHTLEILGTIGPS